MSLINPFRDWAVQLLKQRQGEKVTTTELTADVKAYEKDLVDRAVRYARENELCEAFTEAMDELFPGVVLVDSDGVDCEGNTVRFLNGNGNGVDADQVKKDYAKEIMDKVIRLSRGNTPREIKTETLTYALNHVFPGVRQVDSAGRGL